MQSSLSHPSYSTVDLRTGTRISPSALAIILAAIVVSLMSIYFALRAWG